MIKAVLFDMDGVLIDAKDWHFEALNRALNLFGFNISREAHLSTFDGLPTRTKLDMLTKAQNFPNGLHSFVNRLKQSYTLEISYANCKPSFDHQRALSKLKNEGFKLAVCSNSIRKTVDTLMSLANLASYLTDVISNEDVEKSKPDPEMYNTMINRLQLKPSECLIVEDNENGIRAARASGAHVMVVSSILDVTYENIKNNIFKYNALNGN